MFYFFLQVYGIFTHTDVFQSIRVIPPRYIVAIILAGCAFQPPVTAADGYVGGAIETTADTLIDVEEPFESHLRAAAELSLDAAANTENLQIKLSAAGAYNNEDPAFQLRMDELSFLFYPLEYVRIKAGRFVYRPGTAELLSATNFFSGFNIESLIYQREERYFPPRDLLQASLFAADFYLHLSSSPFLPVWNTPSPSSPWFPRGSFPTSIHIAFPTKQTLTLQEIEIIEAEDEPFSISSISVMAEAGYSFRGADISLLYFRGWDPEFNAKVSIRFPTGLYGEYTIKLIESRSLIQAAGLNIASAFGPLRLWLDASYSLGKLFQTNSISFSELSSSLAPANYLRYTPGISYEIPGTDIVAVAEYKGGFVVQDEQSGLQRPLFSRVAAGVLQASFFDSRLKAVFAALVSVEDGSFVILPKLQYRPYDELLISLHSPFFFGKSDTEFGQFANNQLLSVKLAVYF